MKLTGISALALLAVAGAAVAAPRETTTFPASIPSASSGAVGGGHNQTEAISVLNQTFTGGYTAVRLNLTGTLTSVVAISYSAEAQIYVIPAAGAPFTIAPFTGQTFTSVNIPAGYGVNLAGTGYDPVGQWTYRFFETYQDGAAGATNANWENLVMTFDDAVPPPPPPPTASIDFGVLASSPDFLPAQSTDITDPAQVCWVKFVVPQEVTTVNGRYLDIDTQGSSMADTYMTWFDSTGTPMRNAANTGNLVNDDGGIGLLSLMSFGSGLRPGPGVGALNYAGQDGSLAAGTYWVAACDYFPTGIGAPFQITPGGDLGSITINLRYGQDLPPAPPTTFFDMGAIPTTGTFVTHSFGLDPATVKWAKITIGAIDAAASTYLDLDTETSTALTSAICLFNPDGTIAGQDTIDGSGTLSQLTFGAGTRGPVGNGALYNGRDGATLAAGDYYVAISMTPAAFVPGWLANSTSVDTGDVVLRVRAGTQPAPAAPATFTNLGVIPNTGVFVTSTAAIATEGQVNWYKFTLDAGVDRANREYLDIDTEESTALATAIGLYNADTGAVIVTDTVDGTGTLSQISIGRGVRPAVSDGLAYNGRDGATIAAGEYFLAVTEPPSTFAAPWLAFSGGTETGVNIQVRVRRGVQPAATPPAGSIDLGNLRGDKVVDTEDGNPITITDTQIKWYKFHLSEAASTATTRYVDIDTYGSDFDTELGLYDAAGTLKAANDDGAAGLLSLLTFGDTVNVRPATAGGTDDFARDGRNGDLAAGDCYLAVGKFNTNYADEFDVTSTATGIGTLVINIYNNYPIAVPRCNAADVAGLGGSIGPDLQLTADDVVVYLGAFFSGNLAVADIAVLGGAPGADGQLTADDIVYFLSQFFSPCNP